MLFDVKVVRVTAIIQLKGARIYKLYPIGYNRL